jgi:hypothetical protein
MQAEAGDWQVTNDAGRSWSVAPGIFVKSYEHVAGDRWRRTGRATARPAVAGEVITHLRVSKQLRRAIGSSGDREARSDYYGEALHGELSDQRVQLRSAILVPEGKFRRREAPRDFPSRALGIA